MGQVIQLKKKQKKTTYLHNCQALESPLLYQCLLILFIHIVILQTIHTKSIIRLCQYYLMVIQNV